MLEATIQDCRVFYDIHRHAVTSAPAIVLMHGWGCDSTMFSFIDSCLSERATVITLDFPGHGKSGEPPEPWGVHEYADLVRKLLQENGFSRVDLIGHSFGGRIAIVLASETPELVNKVVITGGAGIKKPVSPSHQKRTKRYKRMNKLLDGLKSIPAMANTVDKWQERLRNHFGSPDYVKLNEGMRKTFVKVISEDLFPLLKDIKAPTLLIWGSADTETPLWMGEQMEQSIPDAGLVIFEGKGHFAFLEEWQRFVVITKQFLLEGQGE